MSPINDCHYDVSSTSSMERDNQLMLSFFKNRQGATAIEYGLICALIFLVIVVSVTTLGVNLGTLYDDIASKVTDAL